MLEKIQIPQLSANVEQAAITDWFKAEGDDVQQGEAIVELTTEKASFEVESPVHGVLRRQVAELKSVLPVGYVIALVGPADADLPDVDEDNRKLMEAQTARPERNARRPRRRKRERTRVRATPAARRLAKELGIDLAELAGIADGGPVSETMVREHAERRDP